MWRTQVSNTVSVIDTAQNVTATVNVGTYPYGVAVSPRWKKGICDKLVSNNTVSVIDTANKQCYSYM